VILEAPGWSDWMPGSIPGQGGRRAGQAGGKILPTHVYRNEEERCRLLPGSVLFRFVAPPLKLGVVGPYPVRGVWFMLIFHMQLRKHTELSM
jgi:hypothetical protein